MARILITSAGGLTGTYLLKHFTQSSTHELIAIDSNDLTPASLWVKEFFLVPPVTDSNYTDSVKRILSQCQPDLLIPVASHDVEYYALNKQQFDTKIITLDFWQNDTLHNKEKCYAFLSSIGIRTPKILRKDEIAFPCLIKPKSSSGSKNIVRSNDLTDFAYWTKKINDCLVVEYLEGDEYTVDCLFDTDGLCVGYNVRKRCKTAGGGVVVTQNCYSEDIADIIDKLERIGWLVGPLNFQYKRNNENEVVIFDFNTRFASGGLPLTVQSGFDIPNLLVKMVLGEKVEKWHHEPSRNGLTMIRYYDELFMERNS